MKKLIFLALSVFAVTGSYSQTLFVNELVARNSNGAMDDFFETNDWIEIFNSGGSLLNLGGYYLSDDPTNLTKWQIPTTNAGVTTILPNDHLIFWMDNDLTQGEDHVGFTLSGDGESVILTAQDGVTIIDQIDYPLMAVDFSYGRSCDACPNWTFFGTPTFDAANATAALTTDFVVVNEAQVTNVNTVHDLQYQFESWIEVYNPNAYQVNLGGYQISINGVSYTIPQTNPYYTAIPAGGFVLLWCDNDLADGTNHLPQTLTTGSVIQIIGPDNSTIDTYTLPSTIPSDQSYGRQSDGSPTSIVFSIPTPRVSNTTQPVSFPTLYINEVMPANLSIITDNYGDYEDWFEIYNPNSFAVNLSGYYFSDNPENPMKWQVPNTQVDSVTVPANGFRLFWADEENTEGVLHASFRLSSISECLAFYSPDGFSLIDEICWANIPVDQSYGRISDGDGAWWTFTSSTPEASNAGGQLIVEDVVKQSSISIYPNPTQGMLFFSEKTSARIYNLTGNLVSIINAETQVDLSDLATGMYTILLDNGDRSLILKN